MATNDARDLDLRFARLLHHATKQTADNAAFAPPIVNTSVYALPPQPSGTYQYARWGNPTWTALEDALGLLEDADVVTFPSGMAAIAAVFFSLLKAGDRVLLPSDGYYTTRICADKYLTPMGVQVETCATAELATRDFTGLRLVMVETPSTPMLDLADIADVCRRAHAAGARVAVDNTTMTPLGQRPLDHRNDPLEMRAACDLRHHAAVFAVQVVLRRNHARADAQRVIDHRGGGLVAGTFDAEDASHRRTW